MAQPPSEPPTLGHDPAHPAIPLPPYPAIPSFRDVFDLSSHLRNIDPDWPDADVPNPFINYPVYMARSVQRLYAIFQQARERQLPRSSSMIALAESERQENNRFVARVLFLATEMEMTLATDSTEHANSSDGSRDLDDGISDDICVLDEGIFRDFFVLWGYTWGELRGCVIRIYIYNWTPRCSRLPPRGESDLRLCISMPRQGGRWELHSVPLDPSWARRFRMVVAHRLTMPIPPVFNFHWMFLACRNNGRRYHPA